MRNGMGSRVSLNIRRLLEAALRTSGEAALRRRLGAFLKAAAGALGGRLAVEAKTLRRDLEKN